MYLSQALDDFGQSPQRGVTPANCGQHEPGEVFKSRNQGLLSKDVIPHARGLLLADYGIDWRHPPDSMKHEQALKDWLADIVKVISANPTTKVRLIGFSDCVGTELHNKGLRAGRATKTLALFHQMLGSGAAWDLLKSKTITEAAPNGDYVASNATVEGRAQNRGVLLQSERTIDQKSTTVRACTVKPSQTLVFPLMGLIPNVPFDGSKLPLDYRINAKKIVGETAQDLWKHAHEAGLIIEAAHWGIIAAEIFAGAGVLAIAAPVLGLASGFFALGAGCMQAAEVVAKDWANRGYATGLVVGADKRTIRELKARFGRDCCPRDDFCHNEKIMQANYLTGLFVGYWHGRMLCPNQREWFWKDLGRRAGDQSHLGPDSKWSYDDWSLWYARMAGVFKHAHVK